MTKGILYLIPTYLSESSSDTILTINKEVVFGIDHFIVESLKTARRNLRSMGYKKNFDTDVTFFEWNKHGGNAMHQWLAPCEKGQHVGLLSESGTPCIADPGNLVVREAHKKGIKVVPLVGANSIILALMASGFSGQHFTFHGYLPINSGERIQQIKKLEEMAKRTDYTQIFMETPFRNTPLIRDLLATLHPQTLLHISCDLTLPTEETKTMKVADWKYDENHYSKRYCIYAIGE